MSKFNLYNLTLKDVLIIKHALRDKVSDEEEFLYNEFSLIGVPQEDIEKFKKNHEEHKRCYEKVEEQVEDIQGFIKR